MLSRVANSIYWMSRYLERADNVARFINVNASLILDMGWERNSAQWEPLVRTFGDEEQFSHRYTEFSEDNVLRFLTFDKKNPNSIISCVLIARENARTVREVISTEMWESINSLYHLVTKHSRKRKIGDLHGFYLEIRDANNLYAGLIENTMSHSEGWHFARVGKMLERADKTARMLDIKYFSLLPSPDYLNSPYDKVEWGAVLKSVSGFEMYLKQFHGVNYREVAQFLMLDTHFPRAFHHCINTAARSLNYITDTLGVNSPINMEMKKLRLMLSETTIDDVLHNGLHEFIDVLQFNLNVIDEKLYHCFFSLEFSDQSPKKRHQVITQTQHQKQSAGAIIGDDLSSPSN